MCLEQAVFDKYSWLPLQHMLSTKMQQLRQKVPPAQRVPRGANKRCAAQGHRHRESTGRFHAEQSSKTVPGELQWQSFQLWEGFSPSFSKEDRYPSVPFTVCSSSSHQHSPKPQGITKQQQNQASDLPSSHLSALCFCQWDFCSAGCKLNFTHVYTT